MTLKLILVSGLYPQVAISDEFNHLKVIFIMMSALPTYQNDFLPLHSRQASNSITPNRNHSRHCIRWDFSPTIRKYYN